MYIGTIDDAATGSSTADTTFDKACSNVARVISTDVCSLENSRAICCASSSSSSSKLVPNPTVYVRHDLPTLLISASSSPESMPPLKRSPTGTSAMR